MRVKSTIILEIICKILPKPLPLHRVFHSIRFKVNKVGTRRSPFFCFIGSLFLPFWVYQHVCRGQNGRGCPTSILPRFRSSHSELTVVDLYDISRPCHFVSGKMTSCHFKACGTLVATIRVRTKELSKVISNNIV